VSGGQKPLLFIERRTRRLAEHQARQKKAAKVIEPPAGKEKPRGRTRASRAKQTP
jgi:hypothetical protein